MASVPPSPPDSAKHLRVLSLDRTHIVAVRRQVAVAIWRRTMEPGAARSAHEALRDVAKRHPGEALYVNVIRAGVAPPNDEVRRELVAMVRSGAGALRGAAILAQGNAFVGSLVRSVVAGMVMISRPAFPMKVFGEAAEAAEWLGSLAGGVAVAREVEATIADASARLDVKATLERASRPRVG